ncbi:MAG: hypothetical protein GXP62_21215 [Oligoflexia bacterium]|nr:hypothetical protein [Oligoflexia bacterium]
MHRAVLPLLALALVACGALNTPAAVADVPDGCGHVYDQLLFDAGPAGLSARRDSHSYFEGEADRVDSLSLPDHTVAADALPVLVRDGEPRRGASPHLGPGRRLRRGVTRRAYWQEHNEGQESLRSELGLPQHVWPKGATE